MDYPAKKFLKNVRMRKKVRESQNNAVKQVHLAREGENATACGKPLLHRRMTWATAPAAVNCRRCIRRMKP